MLLASDIPRMTIVQIRSSFAPRRFAAMSVVSVTIDGEPTTIELLWKTGYGCVRGARRWLKCSRCARGVNTLGFIRGVSWCCRRCLGWRSRPRPLPKALAPHEIGRSAR